MISPLYPGHTIRPYYAHGIIMIFFLGFYLGLLFGVGALVALTCAMVLFRGKFRLMVGMGGGFFGLATWFSILLNYKDKYEQLVAYLAQYLGKNWAVFLTDSTICSIGSILFVLSLTATHRGAKTLVATVRGGGKKKEESTPPAEV